MMNKGKKEENAVVLDFLQNGYPDDKSPSHLKSSIAQAMGTNDFTLLELVPRKDVFLQPYEEVYIGASKRDKIHHISGKLDYEKLTSTAKSELEHVVRDIVKNHEERFVKFFNTAMPLNTRVHVIELLPGVGKKHMLEIVEERKEKEFESFKDLKSRVKLTADPDKLVANRIVSELKGDEKYNLFISSRNDR